MLHKATQLQLGHRLFMRAIHVGGDSRVVAGDQTKSSAYVGVVQHTGSIVKFQTYTGLVHLF
jgi:hypothetical protein